MVDAISPINASAATSATAVDRSLSIASEPGNKWVAERQSRIDADQNATHARNNSSSNDLADEEIEEEIPPLFEGHARRRKARRDYPDDNADQTRDHVLSGESERIGSTNFDDDTPFGERTAII